MRNKKVLKAECESRGLNVGGNWDTLVARLEENDRLNAQRMAAGSTPNQLISRESGKSTLMNSPQSTNMKQRDFPLQEISASQES